MAKFRKAAGVAAMTVNKEDAPAYSQSAKLELASLVLTSFIEDKFYSKKAEDIQRIQRLASSCGAKFSAKTALLARNKFGMRSASHVLAAEAVHLGKGQQVWPKLFLNDVVRRPDDALEILAYEGSVRGKVPNAMKKGLGLAMGKFDAYQLSKYKGGTRDIKLVDLFNLCHPKPPQGRKELYKSLIDGTIEPPETWEVKLSQAGSDADAKEKVWYDLVSRRKIGYFALLRNLRNILQQAPSVVDEACRMLCEEHLIRKSLVFPYRYLAAYRQLTSEAGSGPILQAIGIACEIALQNIPKFEGQTLSAFDTSGSMDCRVSEKSVMRLVDIGMLFGTALSRSGQGDAMQWADKAQFVNVDPTITALAATQSITTGACGHGTNMAAIFDLAVNKAQVAYDRIVIFSDMQTWRDSDTVSYYGTTRTPTQQMRLLYEKHTGKPVKIFTVDLAGYGNMAFPEKNTYCLAGFSDKLFELMKILEEEDGPEGLVRRIDALELRN